MFASTGVRSKGVSFKCADPGDAVMLIDLGRAEKAPYLTRGGWVFVRWGGMRADELRARLTVAYLTVRRSLPKKVQAVLGRSPANRATPDQRSAPMIQRSPGYLSCGGLQHTDAVAFGIEKRNVVADSLDLHRLTRHLATCRGDIRHCGVYVINGDDDRRVLPRPDRGRRWFAWGDHGPIDGDLCLHWGRNGL